jgi:hypothetical protein
MSDEEKVIYLTDVRARIDAPGTPCPLFPNEAIEVCGDADPECEPHANECENAPLCRAAMVGKAAPAAARGEP